MRGANVKLRDQRDVLINVADKNQNISDNLKVAATTIRQISRAEWRSRIILYFTILVLFITDVVLCVLWITKTFGSG